METPDLNQLQENIALVRQRLDKAAAGRAYTLLAATKTQSAEVINLLPQCEIFDYGENRVQEWVEKHEKIDKSLKYHQIGRLQSNKIKYIINEVTLIHSVDKFDLAKEIDRLAAKCGRSVEVLLQVNTAAEEQKGGVDPDGLMQLYEQVQAMDHLRVKGLMCMAPLTADERIVHETFAGARRLFEKLQAQDRGISVLSMGMSGDAHIALEEGSTLVRMGTALFGARTGYPQINS